MTSTPAIAPVVGSTGSDRGGGREQWLRAGQALLRRGGIRCVKLHALSDEAGLTTGSFYHHFNGMTEFLEELARFYGGGLIPASDEEAACLRPVDRIRLASQVTEDVDALPLHTAMRDWAGSDPVAAEAVRAADEQLLRFMERAFVDLGHTERAARARALLLFSLGVARVHTPWPAPSDLHDQVLGLLVPAD